MPHFKLENVDEFAGFALEKAEPGQTLKIQQKASTTSEDAEFHVWINNLSNVFFNPLKLNPASINYFLILIHKDKTADIYINDFPHLSLARVNRDVKQGDEIYYSDITDITELNFGDIEIKEEDIIIYSCRIFWKFGLYFDCTKKMDLKVLYKELGELYKLVGFKHLIEQVTSEINKAAYPVFIFTEGKTDWQHLENAKNKLGIRENYSYDRTLGDKGDTWLLKLCEYYSTTDHGKIIICMFDRDNPRIIKDLSSKDIPGKNFQSWGNDVYSFIIPAPSHRSNYENISIEFYYTDNEIRTKNKDGKRLFFDNELELRIKPDKTSVRLEISPDQSLESKKKIFDQDASTILDSNGNQIAISKSVFAQNILTNEADFDNFNVTEFSKIFDVISDILAHSASQKSK